MNEEVMQFLIGAFAPKGHAALERVEGGAVNQVLRLRLDTRILYVKRTTEPRETRLRYVPMGYLPLMTPTRLATEVRAIDVFNGLLPSGMVPTVVLYNEPRRLLVMSDVGGPAGVLLDEVMLSRINEQMTSRLALTAATIATAAPPLPFRGDAGESAARIAKLKYAYLFPCLALVRGNAPLVASVRAFFQASAMRHEALSHGDFHARNIVVRDDDSLGLVDFEEAMCHDAVYDIAVLMGSYVLWAIRSPAAGSRLTHLAGELLAVFRGAIGLGAADPRWIDARTRINNYLAGALMDRVVGINGPEWLKNSNAQRQVRRVAIELLKHSGMETAALVGRLVEGML